MGKTVSAGKTAYNTIRNKNLEFYDRQVSWFGEISDMYANQG